MTAATGLRHPPGVLPVKTGSAVMQAVQQAWYGRLPYDAEP